MDKNTKNISDSNILTPFDRSPRPVMCNYMLLPRGIRHEWKCRYIGEYEYILLLQGEFTFINHDTGEKIIQHPGELLCIYPGEFHSYFYSGSPDEEAFFSCIHFEYDEKRRRILDEYRPEKEPPRLLPLGGREKIYGYFRELAGMFRNPSKFGELKQRAILSLLLLELDEIQSSTEISGEAGKVERMTGYLNENLLKHPSRRDLSIEFHLSCAYINGLFRKHLGMTPTEYVHRRLAASGHELINQGGMSVKEAAAALNFPNAFYFSRVFKKVFGFPPSGRWSEKRRGSKKTVEDNAGISQEKTEVRQ